MEGVVVKELRRYEDDRGWLAELFRHDELDGGLHPAMAYVSETLPGVARGPHEHREQTDIFCFLGTSEFNIYLWDNRGDNRGDADRDKRGDADGDNREVATAPAGKVTMVIVPPGVVHAYRNIGAAPGLVLNAPNRLFKGDGKAGEVDEIRYEDDPGAGYLLD